MISSLKDSTSYYRLARDQNKERMCVEEMGLIPAHMLGGIPAAAAAEGLTSCSLGSCNVQPRPGSQGGSSVSAQGHQLQVKSRLRGKNRWKAKENSRKRVPSSNKSFFDTMWFESRPLCSQVMWSQGGKLRDSWGSGFREKQSQGLRYHLQFCFYLILSCSSFPTLPPPPSVPITRFLQGRGHFLLVVRISDTHMLR